MLRTDRRHTPRTNLSSLAYIQIEPDNGGIVLNVSAQGLCFHSIAPVEPNGGIRLSIIEQNRRIPVCADQVWADPAKTILGVSFGTLTEEARDQIQSWIDQGSDMPEEPRSSGIGGVLRRALPSLAAVPFRADSHTRRRIERAAARFQLRLRIKWNGFSGGVATGFLLSTLIASILVFGYAYRFEFGESLIRWGERLTGKTETAKTSLKAQAPPLAPSESAPSKAAVSTPQSLSLSHSRVALAPAAAQESARERISAPPEARPLAGREPASAHSQEAQPAPVAVAANQPQPSASETLQPPILNKPVAPAFGFNSFTGSQRSPFVAPSPGMPAAAVVGHGTSSRELTASSPLLLPSKATSETAQMYFDLGRFKNETLAHSIAGRLGDAGFHTTVVEKGHLWLNRYQVLVGPYNQENETAKVERELVSRGFKPRPFERGSRNFIFSSSLTLNGIRLPGGDFTITWESYLTHATVQFIQGNDVRTTAQGRWVQRGKRYSTNEFVYLKNPDGSRTLIEVHFSGLDRALAFGKT